MKLKKIFLTPTLAIAALVASIGITFAQTEILTFDDLSWSGSYYEQIPNDYGGLQWNNFFVVNTVQDLSIHGTTDGGVNGVVSPPNLAFNAGGTAAFISDGSFNLNSAYLMAVWNDGLQVEVQGFVGATLIYDNTYSVNTQGSTLINFNYIGVDEVNFISSGGMHHQGYIGNGTQFGMDNVSITLVPEPSTYALVGLGVIVLILRSLTPRWSQRRLPLEFMAGLGYTTIIELAEPLARRRGSALDR